MTQSRFERTLVVGGKTYVISSLAAARDALGPDVDRLPRALRVLLENMLRHEDGVTVTAESIATLAHWPRTAHADDEIAFHPVRVLMPDSSGIPLMADLSAMREALARRGGDPARLNPVLPADLVVDHAVITEAAGSPGALAANLKLEHAQNRERYAFLKWAAGAFSNFRVLPPGQGIVHQINLEYLARPVWREERDGRWHAFPDSLVGMDSHTPMVNALGVIGWGVGGIEAGSALLGEAIALAIPDVVGCRLSGERQAGITSTDIVLTVTQALRRKGVVGKVVEFYGPAAAALSLPDRATLANMAPEYGATMGFFAIDGETLAYLRMTGRTDEDIALAEAYAKAQGLWGMDATGIIYSDTIEIDLSSVEPSLAGPKRPQDRHALSALPASFSEAFPAAPTGEGIDHGSVVIAAITSCTNTSNPSAMLTAALLARNAVARGLRPKSWVKTSFSPGSRVTADYLQANGLQQSLDALGFHVTGFGCMTCGGGSGTLSPDVTKEVTERSLNAVAVLSSNRNFEGRIHPLAKAAYIGAPALVVAYALAGRIQADLSKDSLGTDRHGAPVFLRDIWPADAEIAAAVAKVANSTLFRDRYARPPVADADWTNLSGQGGPTFRWDAGSSYLHRAPFFDEGAALPQGDIRGGRALLMLGDSITTDHISPGGQIPATGPAADYLKAQGIAPKDFHSSIARRGNHHVMIRGTFANSHLANEAAPDTKGGVARHWPGGETLSVFDAAERYRAEGVPLVVVAGKDYGSGSSRDWAAKGVMLLGIRAVIAESFERIHRSNLVGMGVLPLQFADGATRQTLGLTGGETFTITGLGDSLAPRAGLPLRITRPDGSVTDITVRCRIDTPRELQWYRAGGVLNFVLENMLKVA